MTPDDANETVIYEVDYAAEAAIEGPFDTWLRDHTADVLQFDGFLSAELLDDDAVAPPGRVRRIVQYRLRNRAALETYLREHAPRMRQQGVDRFGDRYSVQRRVLAHREEFIRGAFSTENCLNCGEVLRGQHCSHCGQRAKVRVLSLSALLRDLFGDLTNFDSRLWRTHYSPPFRMYLILSVVFFLLTTVGGSPGDALRFDVSPDGEGGASLQVGPGEAQSRAAGAATTARDGADAAPDAAAPQLDPERQRIVDAIVQRVPEGERPAARQKLEREFAGMTPEQVAPVRRLMNDPCSEDNLKIDIGPLGEQYAPRLREACRRIASDGRGFGRALYENIPKMMFIFLPLIAAVMFALYLGSGRYYVEHLLFFVHFHAFFFLGGIAVLSLQQLSSWLPQSGPRSAVETVEGVVTAALVFYIPYYLYRAMRRVYEQGRVVTLVKYSLLVVGYLLFLSLTIAGLVLYTALTL